MHLEGPDVTADRVLLTHPEALGEGGGGGLEQASDQP